MLLATPAFELMHDFSPDGRFFAFSSNETGQREVYVREVASGRTFPVSTSTHGGVSARWSQDGREIYYYSSNGPGILAAEVAMEPFSASAPVEISDIVQRRRTNFDVTADGQRFLVTLPANRAGPGNPATATPPNPRRPQLVRGVEAAGTDGAVGRAHRDERRVNVPQPDRLLAPPIAKESGRLPACPEPGRRRRW